jgi:hypothetical protein
MVAIAIGRGFDIYLLEPHPDSLKVFAGLLSLFLSVEQH